MAPKPMIKPPTVLGKRKSPPPQTPTSKTMTGNNKPQQPPSKKLKRKPITIRSQDPTQAYPASELSVVPFLAARAYEIRALEACLAATGASNGARRAFQKVPRSMRRRTASYNVKRIPTRLRALAAWHMREDRVPAILADDKRKQEREKGTEKKIEKGKGREKTSGNKPKKTPSNKKSLRAGKREEKSSLVRRRWLRMDALKRARGVRVKLIREMREKKKQRKGSEAGEEKGKIVSKAPRLKKEQLGVLKERPLVKAKFRKRQKNKSWLPTHVYHAKRAHMTRTKEPFWGFALPISPNEKCYRMTHRSSSLRGAIAWDMSYMSTIALRGDERSILGLFKALGVDVQEKHGQKWKAGLRAWEGTLFRRQEYPLGAICPAEIIWEPRKEGSNGHRVLIRVHPAAFLEAWTEILRLSKVQKPSLTIEDLRYEIGSIKVIGPAATEALINALRPIDAQDFEETWNSLKPLENPALLPANALMYFSISDPRLNSRIEATTPAQIEHESLLQTTVDWFKLVTSPEKSIHNRDMRLSSTKYIRSRTIINRRLSSTKGAPEIEASDPRIPIALYASARGNHCSAWTLLMPWPWVEAVWRALMHSTLSTGGNVRFGGVTELRQVIYESGKMWFPGDWPGTKAGMEWEERERRTEKTKWAMKPPGRRIEMESVDLGNGAEKKGEIGNAWGCDWDYLAGLSTAQVENTVEKIPATWQVSGKLAQRFLCGDTSDIQLSASQLATALVGVKIEMLSTGVPGSRARIYRLPSDGKDRQKWLRISEQVRGRKKSSSMSSSSSALLECPVVPGEDELIGFVTTGNYNLSLGEGMAVGSLSLARIVEGSGKQQPKSQLCIVREVGQKHSRLAQWELIT